MKFDFGKLKNNKLVFAATGGALITASVGSMVAYLSRKKEDQDVGVGMLLGAVAGLTAGILLAYEPERRARRRVVVDQMFDEDDAQVADLIGADCVLVSCGHMSYQRLAKLKPVYKDPYEAIKSVL